MKKLGEFSPIGWECFASFSEITEVSQKFGLLFVVYLFDKMGVGLYFGRFFSQTHPVALTSTLKTANFHSLSENYLDFSFFAVKADIL
jgi:hypothetical protein